MKRVLLLTTCLFVGVCLSRSFAQADSCHLRISILTCSPGDELYSLFGHTALRIIDSSRQTDVVYNWGTFNFEEPNFYTKFIRGQLLYYAAADKLSDFLYEYEVTGRNVHEQELKVSCADKQRIADAVDFNMQGDNRFYKYDFLFDNCTTRVRDIVLNPLKNVAVKSDLVPPGTTFRNMIHGYLDRGNQPWSKLGIDILLGSVIDRPATLSEAMFLPEYLMKALDSASLGSGSIVLSNKPIVVAERKDDLSRVYVPLIWTGGICILIFLLSLSKNNAAKKITRIIDGLLLYITGLLGLLLLFMWFGTDHDACARNYNLLWTLPTNIVAVFFLSRRPAWLSGYFFFAAIVTAILLIGWFWLPQEFNIALSPFVLLLLNRYVHMAKQA